MSNRIRGQEQTIRIARDGQLLLGTFTKVKSFKATPRDEIKEEDYMGESTSDLDYQFHGWDLSIDFDEQDRKVIDLVQDGIARDIAHQQPPVYTVTVMTTYRESGMQPTIEVFKKTLLRNSDRGSGGRKERVSSSFEGKCKTREVISG